MGIFLETDRLTLRTLTLDDAELLFRLDGDPEVMRYLSGGPPTPLALIRDEIVPRFIGYERVAWAGAWAAELRGTGQFIGWFSLRPGEDPGIGAELGYRLARACWGQGLATEGAGALVDKAFAELALPRVFGTTYEFNAGSRRVMEKLGMTFVRAFRLPPADPAAATFASEAGGDWDGDEVEYALERADWERHRRAE